MAVNKQQQSQADQEAEKAEVKSKYDKIGDDLVDGLDLSFDEDPEKKKEEPEEEDESEEEESEEESDEESEDEEDEESEEDEEDVVPVSKMKKRLNAEKARRQVLEAELEEMKAKNKTQPDSRRAKLEAMNPQDLKALKSNAKSELRNLIRSGDDPARESELDNLIEEVDEIIQTAPNRFQKRQVEEFDKAAKQVVADPKNSKIDFDKQAGKIKELAASIYGKYPELKNMETGQAVALKLAVDHFRETFSSKGKDIKSKQEKTNLKRKTALDVGQKKGKPSSADVKKQREKLRGNPSYQAREEFVESLLDVDKYLPANLKG